MPNTERRQSLSEGKQIREGWASRKRGAPGRLTATALALAAVLPAPAVFAQAQGLRADAGEVTTLGSVVVTGEKVRRTVKKPPVRWPSSATVTCRSSPRQLQCGM